MKTREAYDAVAFCWRKAVLDTNHALRHNRNFKVDFWNRQARLNPSIVRRRISYSTDIFVATAGLMHPVIRPSDFGFFLWFLLFFSAQAEAQHFYTNKLTNVSSWTYADLASGLVVGTQLVGCFCVGEILSRRQFTGYPQGAPAHH